MSTLGPAAHTSKNREKIIHPSIIICLVRPSFRPCFLPGGGYKLVRALRPRRSSSIPFRSLCPPNHHTNPPNHHRPHYPQLLDRRRTPASLHRARPGTSTIDGAPRRGGACASSLTLRTSRARTDAPRPHRVVVLGVETRLRATRCPDARAADGEAPSGLQ
jgi:hypothetical protein